MFNTNFTNAQRFASASENLHFHRDTPMLLVMAAMVFVLFAGLLHAPNAGAQDLAGIKCVVQGEKAASPDISIDYKDGQTYFCCDDCKAAFKKDMELDKPLMAIKANHQLLLTGQYVQKGCPMSGGTIDENLITKVGGANVGFCCRSCHDKVANTEGVAAKAAIVFSNVAFGKAFELKKAEMSLEGVKCMMMPAKDVSEEFFADYQGHKVHFCCKGCLTKFSKDPSAFTAKANHQLVATGQVKQLVCPISGGDVDEEQVTEVGGVAVKVCCKRCKAKIESAEGDAKVELVFGKKGFKRGYVEEK